MDAIALDFDGVLHNYKSGWKDATFLEEPVEGAQEFCKELQAKGFKLIIFSVRAETNAGFVAIGHWLYRHGFPDGISITHIKPYAKLYVDDRGFRFNGNFNDVLDFIKSNPTLTTWNK